MSDPSPTGPHGAIVRHRLRVKNPAERVDFYCNALGMRNFGTADEPLLGYDERQCLLEIISGATMRYEAQPNHPYWKIGITVRDLGHAVHFLVQHGVSVTEPRQFGDIGYLCHLSDPEGFVIELLQQGFEGKARPAGPGHPVGGQATLAHITLRINDIDAARADLVGRLGMRLMSVQPVTEHGFCLYFFCWSDEVPPDPDPESVANREWLWARPYALLELQHVIAGGVSSGRTNATQAGFAGFGWRGADGSIRYLQPADMRDWL